MKRFSFPLGRVMDWREMQARIEESKLEKLYSELRAIDQKIARVLEERVASQKNLIADRSVSGFDLAALDAFRRFSVLEHTRLERARADCAARVAAQVEVVSKKRRDVRLLERLKQDRLVAWQVDSNRETDAQAEESHLAKWNRREPGNRVPRNGAN